MRKWHGQVAFSVTNFFLSQSGLNLELGEIYVPWVLATQTVVPENQQ